MFFMCGGGMWDRRVASQLLITESRHSKSNENGGGTFFQRPFWQHPPPAAQVLQSFSSRLDVLASFSKAICGVLGLYNVRRWPQIRQLLILSFVHEKIISRV